MYQIDEKNCVSVADCVPACPVEAIATTGNGKFKISDDCTDCGAREPVCDAKAIHRVQ